MAITHNRMLWVSSLQLSEQLSVHTTLTETNALSLDPTANRFAKRYTEAALAELARKGELVDLWQAYPNLPAPDSDTISVPCPSRRRRNELAPLPELHFQVLLFDLPGQRRLAYIPALGVQTLVPNLAENPATTEVIQEDSHSDDHNSEPRPTADSPQQRIREAINLHLRRQQLKAEDEDLLALLWYQQISTQAMPCAVEVLSLSERENLDGPKSGGWLKLMARRLEIRKARCFGRAAPLALLQQAFAGELRPSVLVVGASGTGKTALIEQFDHENRQQRRDLPIWHSTAAKMLQALSSEDGWQPNLASAIDELEKARGVLYVRNLAQLFEVGTYEGNALSMADLLREPLARGRLSLITEATTEELARIDQRLPGFSGLFQLIRLPELPKEQLPEVIRQKLAVDYPQVTFSNSAITEAVTLQQRYAMYSGFPGKSLQFFISLLEQRQLTAQQVDRDAVIQRFCEESGMPKALVDIQASGLDRHDIQQQLAKQVVGQEAAVAALADTLVTVKARLNRPGQPIASLLFVGPTGVGKTALAKALALLLFGDERRLLRFDMSEYADPNAILRLTGDGGHAEGLLTAAVRQQPFSVLLFDELEKADSGFFDLLLQILGEARLSDRKGRLADFSSTVVIMTSNIGAQSKQQQPLGFVDSDTAKAADQHQAHYMEAVQKHFRPEWVNRLDRIVAFRSLAASELETIVQRELRALERRDGLGRRQVELIIHPALPTWFAQRCANHPYGARALQRQLHQQVVEPLARSLNRYAEDVSLRIELGMAPSTDTSEDSTISMNIKAFTEKDRLLQTITHAGQDTANVGLNLQSLAADCSAQARSVLAVQTGPSWNRVLSELYQLDKQRRRREQAFWDDMLTSHRYSELQNLKLQMQTLHEHIMQLDEAIGLDLFELDSIAADIPGQLLDWQQQWLQQQLNICQFAKPEFNQLVIGVYGPAGQLGQPRQWLERIATVNNFKLQLRQVWLNQAEEPRYLYSTPQQAKPVHAGKQVGEEFLLSGPAVALYFAGEAGRHSWVQDEKNQYRYAMDISPGSTLADYETPAGVERKDAVKQRRQVRTYHDDGYREPAMEQDYQHKHWQQQLIKRHQQRWQRRVNDLLGGKTIPGTTQSPEKANA